MVLFVVAPGKFYFQITFSDVPPEYILGGACLVCGHKGPVNRWALERRWGALSQLRHVDDNLKCMACTNKVGNMFTVYGRAIRHRKTLPAGVEEGVPPEGRSEEKR